MNCRSVSQAVIGLAIVIFLLAGCGTVQMPLAATSVPEAEVTTPASAAEVPTTTPAPILSVSTSTLVRPTATTTYVPPTALPTSEAPTGTVQGRILGAESQEPLAGAAVVLCLIVREKTCVFQADLVATSGEDGTFELSAVPTGAYVVFYNPSGKAKDGWKAIDGLEMILKLEGLVPAPSSEREELFSTFGGESAISVRKGTTLEWNEGKFSGQGSIISEEYDLTMDFHEGKPITVQIQIGEITELKIEAWAQ